MRLIIKVIDGLNQKPDGSELEEIIKMAIEQDAIVTPPAVSASKPKKAMHLRVVSTVDSGSD